MNRKPRNNRFTFRDLVCEYGLHYCCIFALFSRYKQTSMIAARLGLAERTVRLHKQLFKMQVYQCENYPRCMKARGLLKRN